MCVCVSVWATSPRLYVAILAPPRLCVFSADSISDTAPKPSGLLLRAASPWLRKKSFSVVVCSLMPLQVPIPTDAAAKWLIYAADATVPGLLPPVGPRRGIVFLIYGRFSVAAASAWIAASLSEACPPNFRENFDTEAECDIITRGWNLRAGFPEPPILLYIKRRFPTPAVIDPYTAAILRHELNALFGKASDIRI